MTQEEKKEVCYRIGDEGIDYTFRNYSSFTHIQDKKFHELREAFVKAAQELETYVDYDCNNEYGGEEE